MELDAIRPDAIATHWPDSRQLAALKRREERDRRTIASLVARGSKG